MRKFQQRTVLESLRLLKEAHGALRKKQPQQSYAGLLKDCEALALQIREYIAEIPPPPRGLRTISLLEEYTKIAARSADNPNPEKLRRQLTKIVGAAREELKPDRIEVVFFPYRRSMFDSLESVYRAAKADPQCDVYVVPVPYYELSAGRVFGEMHCDADAYPEDIPVTGWQEYDVAKRHPDLVFIHYPYDDMGTNASIHPSFYSKYLREHCGTLVYIPYFVAFGETVAESNVYLPGILMAHRVIVQSETIRKEYIRHYNRFDRQMQWNGMFGDAGEKFVSLGSPKFDAVTGAGRADYQLPAAWREMLVSRGGKPKKVVLYNTHMFSWLNGGEAYFKKLRAVFDTFRGRDDAVLWWRPHPNTELNFRVQRPELYDAYLKIVDDYKAGGIGIYDDTPELHRAIAWSDVYYGDWSSLVALCAAAGKPAVIQDADARETFDPDFRIADFCRDHRGSLWAYDLFFDCLLKMDAQFGSAEWMAESGANEDAPACPGGTRQVFAYRYFKILCAGEKVICFPYYQNHILVYDRKTGETVKIPLDFERLRRRTDALPRIRFTPVFDGVVYCFGFLREAPKAVIELNIADFCRSPENPAVEYGAELYEWVGSLPRQGGGDPSAIRPTSGAGDEDPYPIHIGECDESGNVPILFFGVPHLIQYHLPGRTFRIIASSDLIDPCLLACRQGDEYWLVTSDYRFLLLWDTVSGDVRRFPMPDSSVVPSERGTLYSGMICWNGRVLIFPGRAEHVLDFSTQTEMFSVCRDIPDSAPDGPFFYHKYDMPERIGDSVFVFCRAEAAVFEFPDGSKKIKRHKLKMNRECVPEFTKHYLNTLYQFAKNSESPFMLYESALGGIGGFLDALFEVTSRHPPLFGGEAARTAGQGKAGGAIYEYCKKLCLKG